MSPTAARKVAAPIRFTPGTVISRLASGQVSICLATIRSTCSISRSRNAMWVGGLDRLGLLGRQAQPAKPLAALDPEQVGARRLALKPAHQHRVHLVLDPGAGADQLLAARQPPRGNRGDLLDMPSSQLAALPGTSHEGVLDRVDWLSVMIVEFLAPRPAPNLQPGGVMSIGPE
jgi:hypothetical protein